MKTKVAMLFGGKSVEHEVSVISGIQAIMNMDTEKYEVIPVYMTKKNEMYIGDDIGKIECYKDIKGLLSRSQRVIMINEDDQVKLVLVGENDCVVDIEISTILTIYGNLYEIWGSRGSMVVPAAISHG